MAALRNLHFRGPGGIIRLLSLAGERRAIELELGCRLDYQVAGPTAFVFNIEVARFDRQAARDEHLTVVPDLPVERFSQPDGGRTLRVLAPPGTLRVDYRAAVTLDPVVVDPALVGETPPAQLPLSVLLHLNPSRYCQSDRLATFAQQQFGGMAPGHARVTGVCNWVCDNIQYLSGSSDPLTSATDTLLDRQGVCRDFAHLAIALCRALGIPARYVSAYAWRLNPPDFHAVFEAWLEGPDGGAWYLFDATRKAALDGLVRIGLGRDAGEVAFCSIFGEAASGAPQVWIKAAAGADGPLTTEAVSLSSA